MNFIKVISTELDTVGRRIVKFFRYGKNDVQTSPEASPYGIDSNPVAGLIAIYGKTSGDGDTVVVGYIQKDKLSDVGELRIFATDDQGVEQNYMWLKNDGDIEIGGNDDNMVRFTKLKEAFDELKADYNDLVLKFNAHIHVTPAGPSSPITLIEQGSASTADINPSKIDNIKTTS